MDLTLSSLSFSPARFLSPKYPTLLGGYGSDVGVPVPGASNETKREAEKGLAAGSDPARRVCREQLSLALTSQRWVPGKCCSPLYLAFCKPAGPSFLGPALSLWVLPAERGTKGGIQPRSPINASVCPLVEQSSSQQRREKLPVRLSARPGQEGGRGGLPRLSIPQRVGTREVATLTIPSVPQNKCQPWPPACVMPLGCQMPLHFQVAKSPALCTNAVCFSRAVPAWPRFRCIVDVPLTSIARI